MRYFWLRRLLTVGYFRPLWVIVAGCSAINVAMWIVALRFFPRQNLTAILHYSIDAGVDFVGEGQHITVLPLLGSTLLVLNLIIGFAVVKADKAAAWVLWSSMPLVQLCLSVGLIFLWRIN